MKVITSFTGGNRFLSNFHPAPVTHEGVRYPSAEHAFQANKTMNPTARRHIARLPTPAMAKKMGGTIVLRPDWDAIRVGVMRDIVTLKFTEPELRAKLLATGTAKLEEGNTWNDTFWGVYNGVGKNWLGRILMELRATIRRAEQKVVK